MSTVSEERQKETTHFEEGIAILDTSVERIKKQKEECEREKEQILEREQKERENEQRQFNQKQLFINRRALRTQIALVFFGVAGLLYNAYQIHIANLSNETSMMAGKLASKSVDQAQIATRAWLTAEVTMVRSRSHRRLYVPHVSIQNDGHSPALLVTRLESGFSPKQILNPEELPFEELSLLHPDDDQSVTRIGPHGEVADLPYFSDLHGTTRLTGAREIKQKLRREFLYVWGDVLYEDAFHHKHLFEFCYSHFPSDPQSKIMSCNFLNEIGQDLPDDVIYVTPTVDGPRLHRTPDGRQ